MLGPLGKLFKSIDESETDQETKEAYQHIYTSVSEKYHSHIQHIRRLHATEGNPPHRAKKKPTSKPYIHLRD
jgi:hypothetical protein